MIKLLFLIILFPSIAFSQVTKIEYKQYTYFFKDSFVYKTQIFRDCTCEQLQHINFMRKGKHNELVPLKHVAAFCVGNKGYYGRTIEVYKILNNKWVSYDEITGVLEDTTEPIVFNSKLTDNKIIIK